MYQQLMALVALATFAAVSTAAAMAIGAVLALARGSAHSRSCRGARETALDVAACPCRPLMRSLLLSSALVVALFVSTAAAQTSSRFEGRLVQEGTGASRRGRFSVHRRGERFGPHRQRWALYVGAFAPAPIPDDRRARRRSGRTACDRGDRPGRDDIDPNQSAHRRGRNRAWRGAQHQYDARLRHHGSVRARKSPSAIPRTSCRRWRPSLGSTRSPRDMPQFPRSVGSRAAGLCS